MTTLCIIIIHSEVSRGPYPITWTSTSAHTLDQTSNHISYPGPVPYPRPVTIPSVPIPWTSDQCGPHWSLQCPDHTSAYPGPGPVQSQVTRIRRVLYQTVLQGMSGFVHFVRNCIAQRLFCTRPGKRRSLPLGVGRGWTCDFRPTIEWSMQDCDGTSLVLSSILVSSISAPP